MHTIKYHSPQRAPWVQLRYECLAGYTVLVVSDNGLGLDVSKGEKIFGMFGRLHNHVEGSGIGLYMVKKIIENAGGKIEVESQLGVGSTFRVYFPKGGLE